MEPIFKEENFSQLLRIWKFITIYYDYVNLPEKLHDHISSTYRTSFLESLIVSLVNKAKSTQNTTKKHITALYFAKNNKFSNLQDLIKISSFQLALSQTSFAIQWRNLPHFPLQTSFQNWPTKQKYRFLSLLTDLVTISNQFKTQYFEKLKQKYSEDCKVEGSNQAELYRQYQMKQNPSIILGKDTHNSYFYFNNIGDSVLKYSVKKKQWSRIMSKQQLKQEIIQKIMKKEDTITIQEIDLLQNLNDIWGRKGWKMKFNAFDQQNREFDINERPLKFDKLETLKEKMHEMQELYSKYLFQCYNSRWNSKKERIQYHQSVANSIQISHLFICFSDFFNRTKHKLYKKIKNFQPYDYLLSNPEVQSQIEFRQIFLHGNYLYSKSVISQQQNSKVYNVSLYHLIKDNLNQPQEYEAYQYEYLMVYLSNMIGIIQQMYPKDYEKRLKLIEKEQQRKYQQQKKEQQRRRQKSNGKPGSTRLKKLSKMKHEGIQLNIDSSQQSKDQQESGKNDSRFQSGTDNSKSNQNRIGRFNLRKREKMNYRILNQNYSISNRGCKKAKPKVHVKGVRKQPKRNAKRMAWDSQSQDSSEQTVIQYEQDTQENNEGLNLDNYQYIEDDQTNKVRRSLRNSKENKR